MYILWVNLVEYGPKKTLWNISIRIKGVDTPEIYGKYPAEKTKALAAKTFVRKILERADRITLMETGRGKYFRIVARVVADKMDVAESLLKEGLAVPCQGGHKTNVWCSGVTTKFCRTCS